MGDGKALAKGQRHAFHQQADGDGRGVRGNNRLLLANTVEAPVQILLDVEAFHHGLGNPVAIGQLLEIVARIAEMNKSFGILADQTGLVGVTQSFEPAFGQSIGIVIAG